MVMDDPASSIVSYLCGLNALGSWPQSVLVHIIKAHEEEEEGTLKLLRGQVHGEATSHSCCSDSKRFAKKKRKGFYNSYFFYHLF